MGAQVGNRNAAKAKQFEGAIRRAIAQHADPDALKTIATMLVDEAIGGNLYAANLIADRLDGKPAQVISGDPDAPLVAQNLTDAALMAIAAGASMVAAENESGAVN